MASPTAQRIRFLPCPAEGSSSSGADANLRAYCEVLTNADPVFAIKSDNEPNVDNAHLHQMAIAKFAAIPGSSYGISTSTTPHRVAHELDPATGNWSSNSTAPNSGLIYHALTPSGPQFIAIRYA